MRRGRSRVRLLKRGQYQVLRSICWRLGGRVCFPVPSPSAGFPPLNPQYPKSLFPIPLHRLYMSRRPGGALPNRRTESPGQDLRQLGKSSGLLPRTPVCLQLPAKFVIVFTIRDCHLGTSPTPLTTCPAAQYVTDVVAAKARALLRSAAADPMGRPFFLQVAPPAPHHSMHYV